MTKLVTYTYLRAVVNREYRLHYNRTVAVAAGGQMLLGANMTCQQRENNQEINSRGYRNRAHAVFRLLNRVIPIHDPEKAASIFVPSPTFLFPFLIFNEVKLKSFNSSRAALVVSCLSK